MKIDAARENGSVVLRLEGRLDREWAEHLSHALEDLLRDGVRSLRIDLSGVTYMSSAATAVLSRWRQELALLRGEVRLTAVPAAVSDVFAMAGWDGGLEGAEGLAGGPLDFRRSSWHERADFATRGQYEVSSCTPERALTCRLYGDPARLAQAPLGADDCRVATLSEDAFALGLGAIGADFAECAPRLGELVAVAGCVAYFPSDGARLPDYLIGGGRIPPRAVLGSGLVCEGGFSQLVRFSPKGDAASVDLSELASVGLQAAGGNAAGIVVAAETRGLAGARLRRSPADAGGMRFEVPAVRDWLSFSPEPTYAMATILIAGVVARNPKGPLAPHLRPLEETGRLQGHFHAAVFSYHPLPHRTVELGGLTRDLFTNHQLRDVLHLLWDPRGAGGVGQSALIRGVGWVAPIHQII